MTNRAALRERRRRNRRRIWIGVVLIFAAALTVVGLRLYTGFRAVADVPFSPPEASAALEERTPDEVEQSREEIANQEDRAEDPLDAQTPTADPALPAPQPEDNHEEVNETPVVEEPPPVSEPVTHVRSATRVSDRMFETVLMMGADASGYLADAIILALFPEGGGPPAMVSIPRDLYLFNFCSEDYRRVNANLGGCTGYASGPELLALAIEDFTGVPVDHFARIDFDGFVELVDGLGGVEICFDYPTRDVKAHLDVSEPGCYSDGETALAYARSRNAEQLVDGEWQRAWTSDFSRQRHQRELLLNLADRLRNTSRVELLLALEDLSHTLRLDRGWSVTQVVDMALAYRDLDPSAVAELTIPVEDYVSPAGAQVLVPTEPFADTLSQWWQTAD